MSNAPSPEEHLEALDARLHILEGLVKVMDEPHELLDLLLISDDAHDAVGPLRKRYELTEVQALAVLDMQFRRMSRTDSAMVRRDLYETWSERRRLSSS